MAVEPQPKLDEMMPGYFEYFLPASGSVTMK